MKQAGVRGAVVAGWALACVAAGQWSCAAVAQSPQPSPEASAGAAANPDVVRNLIACRNLTDSAARLDCFDRSSAALQTATEQRQIIVVDREEVREARRGLFGLRLPRINLFRGSDADDAEASEDEVREIQSTIASSARGPSGVLFTLSDGARWRQTDDRTVMLPRTGAPVSIRRSGIGTYFATVNNGQSFKVRREE